MSIIDIRPIAKLKLADEVRLGDGPQRPHEAHALSVAHSRRCQQRFENRQSRFEQDDVDIDDDTSCCVTYEPASDDDERCFRQQQMLAKLTDSRSTTPTYIDQDENLEIDLRFEELISTDDDYLFT